MGHGRGEPCCAPAVGCSMQLEKISPFPGDHTLRVIIETPKGSRNKYSFDPDLGAIRLKKTLPEGMVFPYDFGFIPRTAGDDGDPLDVLVLMTESTAPGCVVDCRLLGVICARQKERSNKSCRNDRYLAASLASAGFAHVRRPGDLPASMLTQLEQFFVDYNRLEGRTYKLEDVRGPKAAWKTLKKNHDRIGD
jgi:inorganic pyrophosphatase